MKLGLPYLVSYIRHTFGTVLRKKWVDIYTISKALGHSDISITGKIYVHNDINVLKEKMKLNEKSGTGVVRTKIQAKKQNKKAT